MKSPKQTSKASLHRAFDVRPKLSSLAALNRPGNSGGDTKPDAASERMAEIREVLIHAAMTVLERSERVAEYVLPAPLDHRHHNAGSDGSLEATFDLNAATSASGSPS